jgi:hypothetical protein
MIQRKTFRKPEERLETLSKRVSWKEQETLQGTKSGMELLMKIIKKEKQARYCI